jgi:hypothetical protein
MTTTHMEQVSSTRKKYVSIQEGQNFITKFHRLEEVCINSRMTNFHDLYPTWNKFHQLEEVCMNSGMTKFHDHYYPHGTSFINLCS